MTETLHDLGGMQFSTRALEVLYPHLERAAEAPFEESQTQIELANLRNGVRCRLLNEGVNIE